MKIKSTFKSSKNLNKYTIKVKQLSQKKKKEKELKWLAILSMTEIF